MKNVSEKATYRVLAPEKKMPPTIIFSRKALKWIECMVDAHSEEIGFYGVVDNMEDYTFYVRDIFYPKHQLITAATCEISPEGENDIMEWLISHNREGDINKMAMWAHSHNTMGVFASGQDDTQALSRMQSTKNNVIRVIVNKHYLMAVSFFDYNQQIQFDNIVWKQEGVNMEDEITAKLTSIRTTLDSDLASTLKLVQILETIQSDPEKKQIMEKVEALKKENAPATKSYTAQNGTMYGEDYYSGGYNRTRVYTPPLPNNGVTIISHDNGVRNVVQTKLNLSDKFDAVQTKLNRAFDEQNAQDVQELLRTYEEF
jgi:hypothetical protein